MGLKRRDFLQLGLAQAVVMAVPPSLTLASPAAPPMRTGPSVLQGATDDTKTQFSIVHDATQILDFSVTNAQGKRWAPDRTDLLTRERQKKAISKVYFSGLQPNQSFWLEIMEMSSEQVIDRREFRTLDLDREDLRFAICSCMDETLHDSKIWQSLVQQKPDVIFFIGDCVYADSEAHPNEAVNLLTDAKPDTLWRRFAEARCTLEIYYSDVLIPIVGVWDDHDFAGNDSNSVSYKFVQQSQANFLSFMAQEESHSSIFRRGPGVSSAVTLSSHLFLLLDDRSYRLEKGSTNRYAQWGAEQEKWMMEQIQNHDGPIWLMNGSQYFPDVPFKESVSRDHAVQFRGFLETLKATGQKVIFASGDVHYSEVSRIEPEILGYETFEITSSSMHSRHFPGAPFVIPNPRRILSTGERNYILVDSSFAIAVANVYSLSADGHTNFSLEIKL